MKTEIVIQQQGKSCVVKVDGEVKFTGGRVAAKQFAFAKRDDTDGILWNVKASGKKVLVLQGGYPAVRVDADPAQGGCGVIQPSNQSKN